MFAILGFVLLAAPAPVLGVDETSFTIDGNATFLLGASFYGGLGVEDPESLEQDLDDLRRCGFNWIRVWATWESDGFNVSAVTADGEPRQPFMDRLLKICDTAGAKRIVVDVTVSRGKTPVFPSSQEQHLKVLAKLTESLQRFRNVYFDVANERNIGDDRHVPMKEIGDLIASVKQRDPKRLCTASHGGDIDREEIADYIAVGKVDFICPHRDRNKHSTIETEAKSRAYLAFMKTAPRIVPVHYQEPFRRGYGEWAPKEDDYSTDLRGARVGGAAGWCFHTGASRESKDGRPRRSFDMRPKEGRLFQQLDSEEKAFAERLRETSN